MKNNFLNLVPEFKAPNQLASESIPISPEQKTPLKEKDISEKIKPFDAKSQAPKFIDNYFIKQNSDLHRLFEENKEKINKNNEPSEHKESAESELLAYYFMELSEDSQDDLLVKHEIIMPDEIRNDLKKISDFIATNKNGFIPAEEILALFETI